MFVTRYALPHHVVVENDTRIYRRNSVLDMFQCRQARRSISRVLSRPWITPWGRGWPFIWDARRRAPRATDPSGGAEGPPGGLSRDSTRLPLLLGLAPGGVYPAATGDGGALATSAGQVERRDQAGAAVEPAIGEAIDPQPLHRGRDQRHAEAGRDQAQRRQHARRLLADLRAVAGALTGGDDRVVKPGPERPAIQDEGFSPEFGQRHPARRRASGEAMAGRQGH